MPHVEAKIIDKHGKTLPLDVPGEICVRVYEISFIKGL